MKKGLSLLMRKGRSRKKASKDDRRSRSDSLDANSCATESRQALEELPNIQSMVCTNDKCGRVFDKPLKLIDLAKPSEECSYVCPYCLSELESTEPEQEVVTEPVSEEKLQDVTEQKDEECPHFVGYLGKRPKNAPIPDFCLTCPKMMECMRG